MQTAGFTLLHILNLMIELISVDVLLKQLITRSYHSLPTMIAPSRLLQSSKIWKNIFKLL